MIKRYCLTDLFTAKYELKNVNIVKMGYYYSGSDVKLLTSEAYILMKLPSKVPGLRGYHCIVTHNSTTSAQSRVNKSIEFGIEAKE